MNIRTDLAMEAIDPHVGLGEEHLSQQTETFGEIQKHTTVIRTDACAERVGKPKGRYTTYEFKGLVSNPALGSQLAELVSETIGEMVPDQGSVLVLGLGNTDITPDAVGPLAANGILATRHISEQFAEALGIQFRSVAALAPGVLGQTGMEVQEITRALVSNLRPEAIVVVDALAAKATSRLGNTVQLCDTGISPGSGVHNARAELSENTLGVPVVAVGIPTVVDVGTLVSEYTDQEIEDEQSRMLVTSKEIDLMIKRCASVLSDSINSALQPHLSLDDIHALTD